MLDKFLPPTDNLYKFISIAGLLLVVLSFVPNYYAYLLYERGQDFLKQSGVFEAEFAQFTKESERRSENYEKEGKQLVQLLEESAKKEATLLLIEEIRKRNLIKIAAYLPLLERTKNEKVVIQTSIEDSKKRLEALRSEWDERSLSIKAKSLEVQKTGSLMVYSYGEIDRLYWIGSLFLLLGSLLMVVGFSLWYFKVQKLHDKILLNQALSTPEEQARTKRPRPPVRRKK